MNMLSWDFQKDKYRSLKKKEYPFCSKNASLFKNGKAVLTALPLGKRLR